MKIQYRCQSQVLNWGLDRFQFYIYGKFLQDLPSHSAIFVEFLQDIQYNFSFIFKILILIT
jgi:hypothetical protein